MPISHEIEFAGLEAYLNQLRSSYPNVTDDAIGVGLRRATNYYTRELRARTPKGKEGALRQSIGSRKLKRSELPAGAETGQMAGPIKKARERVWSKGSGPQIKNIGQFYKAWFLEFGTQAHAITAGAKKMRVGNQFYGAIDVEGITARGFIDKAQRAAFPEMERIFAEEIEKWLDKNIGNR